MLGTVAAYLLLSQLAQVDVADVIAEADWRWAGVALALSFVTYVGATIGLGGFVPDRLSFLRTLQAQFAASFATGLAADARRRGGERPVPQPLGPAPGGGGGHGRGRPGGGVHRAREPAAGHRDRRGTQADLQFNPPAG